MRVALLQTGPPLGGDPVALPRIHPLLGKAASLGCSWALLPDFSEFFALQGTMHLQAAWTQRRLELLRSWARELHVGVLGSLPQSSPGGSFPAAFCIDPQGEIQGLYQAGHSSLLEGEGRMSPGSAMPPPLFQWEDTIFGVLTSREILLPERVREMALRGMELLCVSALWSSGREEFWRGVVSARAAESRIHVLAVNAWSPDETGPSGRSVAVGPWGDVIASLEDGEVVGEVHMEPGRLPQARGGGFPLPEIPWRSIWRQKYMDLREALPLLDRLRRRGRVVVFTNGCFDILHAGHVDYLEAARSLGDLLVVGINTDESVRRIKGPDRPIVSLQDRVRTLSGLQCVDLIIPFAEDTPWCLIEALRPQVLVKGADWPEEAIVGADMVRSLGGRVVRIPLREGLSTSGIVRRIRDGISPKTPEGSDIHGTG